MTILYERGERFYEDDVMWLFFCFFVFGIISALMVTPLKMGATIAVVFLLSFAACKKWMLPFSGIMLALLIPMTPGFVSALVTLVLNR